MKKKVNTVLGVILIIIAIGVGATQLEKVALWLDPTPVAASTGLDN